MEKEYILYYLGLIVIGALSVITANSLGYVVKVDIVSPEQGYTQIQREQLEALMEKK